MAPERVVVAEILRSRGNRGEVVAESTSDVPGRLETLTEAHVHFPDGSDLPVRIENAWAHQGQWVLKFAGVDSISEAARFRGADLWVPREQRGQLAPGDYFRSDLLGCVLRDAAEGHEIGCVKGFEQYGGPLLLEIEARGHKALIPFVPEICREVNLEDKTICVQLPEGLLEL